MQNQCQTESVLKSSSIGYPTSFGTMGRFRISSSPIKCGLGRFHCEIRSDVAPTGPVGTCGPVSEFSEPIFCQACKRDNPRCTRVKTHFAKRDISLHLSRLRNQNSSVLPAFVTLARLESPLPALPGGGKPNRTTEPQSPKPKKRKIGNLW